MLLALLDSATKSDAEWVLEQLRNVSQVATENGRHIAVASSTSQISPEEPDNK